MRFPDQGRRHGLHPGRSALSAGCLPPQPRPVGTVPGRRHRCGRHHGCSARPVSCSTLRPEPVRLLPEQRRWRGHYHRRPLRSAGRSRSLPQAMRLGPDRRCSRGRWRGSFARPAFHERPQPAHHDPDLGRRLDPDRGQPARRSGRVRRPPSLTSRDPDRCCRRILDRGGRIRIAACSRSRSRPERRGLDRHRRIGCDRRRPAPLAHGFRRQPWPEILDPGPRPRRDRCQDPSDRPQHRSPVQSPQVGRAPDRRRRATLRGAAPGSSRSEACLWPRPAGQVRFRRRTMRQDGSRKQARQSKSMQNRHADRSPPVRAHPMRALHSRWVPASTPVDRWTWRRTPRPMCRSARYRCRIPAPADGSGRQGTSVRRP